MPEMTAEDWAELDADFEAQLDEYMEEWEKTLRTANAGAAQPHSEENVDMYTVPPKKADDAKPGG